MYYRCFTEDGKFHIYDYRQQPCPEGLVFDEGHEVCTKKENCEPCHDIPFNINELSVSLCKKEGFFRHPHNCNLYYECINEDGIFRIYDYHDQSCPAGLVFDEVHAVCTKMEKTEPCYNT